jgi:hypothetical protein
MYEKFLEKDLPDHVSVIFKDLKTGVRAASCSFQERAGGESGAEKAMGQDKAELHKTSDTIIKNGGANIEKEEKTYPDVYPNILFCFDRSYIRKCVA